jgi:hypothetical protein
VYINKASFVINEKMLNGLAILTAKILNLGKKCVKVKPIKHGIIVNNKLEVSFKKGMCISA